MFLRSAPFLESSAHAVSKAWSSSIYSQRSLVVSAGKLKKRIGSLDLEEPLHVHDFHPSNRSKGKGKEPKPEIPGKGTQTEDSKLFRSAIDERKFRKIFVERHGQRIKLLTPVVLSARVTHICKQGKLQDAIELVKSSPKGAQNAVVWANLIGFVIGSKKYKESYRLFTEVSWFPPVLFISLFMHLDETPWDQAHIPHL